MDIKMHMQYCIYNKVCFMNSISTNEQAAVCAAMSDPGFHPGGTEPVERVETHISHVFLTGREVFKMKKAVDFGFLDFSTLEKRKRFCEREVDLNRRLAPDVYLGVDAVTREGDRYSLNGEGGAVEYVVRMRRLPESRNMTGMLSRGEVDGAFIDELAGVLTRFYENSERGPEIDEFGRPEAIRGNCEENFVQTAPYEGWIVNDRTFKLVRAVSMGFLERRKSLFQHRVEAGKVRDCHGDLRAEHVYMDDGIKIVDCIEFNERFRYQDTASDLAFLAMDLDFRGYPRISRELLKAYVRQTRDRDVFNLIDFYKIYRAMVRVKVNCFHIDKDNPERREKAGAMADTQRYMKLAELYAEKIFRPTIWVVCGTVATGKSTISKSLAESLDIRVLRSDEIRKRLFKKSPDVSAESDFQKGVYSKHATSLTYGKQLLEAREEIEKGLSVILDATFGDRHRRDEVRLLAEDAKAGLMFVACECPEAVIKKRLEERENRPGVSDARLRHFEDIRKQFAPFDDIPEDMLLRIDTSEPVDDCMERILSEIPAKVRPV